MNESVISDGEQRWWSTQDALDGAAAETTYTRPLHALFLPEDISSNGLFNISISLGVISTSHWPGRMSCAAYQYGGGTVIVSTANHLGETMKRLFTMFAILLAVGCGPTNDTPDPGIPGVDDPPGAVDSCQTASNCGNCVFYAGCRSPAFKNETGDLTTWASKLDAINSKDGAAGCVAIIESGTLGHVAYVTKVDHSPHRVWIEEGNWNGACHSDRSGSKDELRIKGYFCPK